MHQLKDARQSKRGQSGSWASCVVIGLLIYVLSPLPVVFVFERLPEPCLNPVGRGLDVAYIPLGTLYENYEPVETFYDWYLALIP